MFAHDAESSSVTEKVWVNGCSDNIHGAENVWEKKTQQEPELEDGDFSP